MKIEQSAHEVYHFFLLLFSLSLAGFGGGDSTARVDRRSMGGRVGSRESKRSRQKPTTVKLGRSSGNREYLHRHRDIRCSTAKWLIEKLTKRYYLHFECLRRQRIFFPSEPVVGIAGQILYRSSIPGMLMTYGSIRSSSLSALTFYRREVVPMAKFCFRTFFFK